MSTTHGVPEIKFGPCCFCGKMIESSTVDPCRVTVETATGRWQVWFSHAVCSRNQLVDIPMLEAAIF
jgi:hypothetical protein